MRLEGGFERFAPDLFRALKNPCPKRGPRRGPGRGPRTPPRGPGTPGPMVPGSPGTPFWTGSGTPKKAKITMTPRCLRALFDQNLSQNWTSRDPGSMTHDPFLDRSRDTSRPRNHNDAPMSEHRFCSEPVPKLVHPMGYGGSGQTPKIPSPEKALPNWQKVVKSLMRGRGF